MELIFAHAVEFVGVITGNVLAFTAQGAPLWIAWITYCLITGTDPGMED